MLLSLLSAPASSMKEPNDILLKRDDREPIDFYSERTFPHMLWPIPEKCKQSFP